MTVASMVELSDAIAVADLDAQMAALKAGCLDGIAVGYSAMRLVASTADLMVASWAVSMVWKKAGRWAFLKAACLVGNLVVL